MTRVRADVSADWPTVDVEAILDCWTLDEVRDLLRAEPDALEELAMQVYAGDEPDDVRVMPDRGDLEAYLAERRQREGE